jgi:transcriptional regulator with XRE-family HTH domain
VGKTTRRPALTKRRKAVGHTQESLAELLGVDRSTIVRWESGVTEPTPVYRPKIAETLGLSLEELDRILTESAGLRGPVEPRQRYRIRTDRPGAGRDG